MNNKDFPSNPALTKAVKKSITMNILWRRCPNHVHIRQKVTYCAKNNVIICEWRSLKLNLMNNKILLV